MRISIASVQRHAPRAERAAAKLRQAQAALAREEQQAGQQKMQTAVSFGATLLGALLGRKSVSVSTLGRATTAVRGVSRTMKEAEDVARARARQQEAMGELEALEKQLAEELAALGARNDVDPPIETIEIKPRRGGIDVRLIALAWKPRD